MSGKPTYEELEERVRVLESEALEREKAKNALEESEVRFRTLAESAPFGLSMMRPDRTFEYFNPKFMEMFGYTLEDIPTKDLWFEKAYPDEAYRKEVFSIWTTDLIENLSGIETEPRVFTVRCANGKDKTIRFRAAILRDGKQFITSEDISARGGMEEALSQSLKDFTGLSRDSKRAEEIYRSFLNSSADAVIIYDLEGKTLHISSTFTGIFGWTPEEIMGKRIPFVPDSEMEATMATINSLLATGMPCRGFETKRLTKDGRVVDVSISGSLYADGEGKPAGILSILHDISGRKRLESELLQAQKIQSIGSLAMDISHDFNNILQVISGYTQILMMGKNQDHRAYGKLQAIEKAVHRGSDLTRRLLTFSRKVEIELRTVDLNHEVEEVVRLLEQTVPKTVKIQLDLSPGLLEINADPHQVQEIVMSLGVNARNAMPDGGRLTFRTAGVVLDEDYCITHGGMKPGGYAELNVSYTRACIDGKAGECLHDSLSNTGENGKPTDLGLAMLYGMVKNQEGHVTFSTEHGRGTVFRIYFPVLKTEVEGHELLRSRGKKVEGGTETVLIVDDEAVLLDLQGELLRQFGYTVIEAESGEKAMEILSSGDRHVHLVILDLHMPGMGGYRCLKKMLEWNPAIKVIVTSGYSTDRKVREAIDSESAGFLAKPYHHSEMLTMIREVLDKGKSKQPFRG